MLDNAPLKDFAMPKARLRKKATPAELLDPAIDPFITALVHRKANQLVKQSGFDASEQMDLTQDLIASIMQSLKAFDESVGHKYPFILAVVDRHVCNLLRTKKSRKRTSGAIISLNVSIALEDAGPTELIQTIGDREMDRRLGRDRLLSEEQLSDLRLDLARIIQDLPAAWQDLIERRKSQSVSEIARDLGIPRTTLNLWLLQIRERFAAAGLEEYLHT